MEQRGDLGEIGVCYFEDNLQCEEWALLRGDCPVGGVKVTGYATEAARYCAITGGTYAATGKNGQADEQGTCTFTTGVRCDAWDYYNGKCDASAGTAPATPNATLVVPSAEVCAEMAQALTQALTKAAKRPADVKVTQSEETLALPGASGAGCRAQATGTGEQFKGPDSIMKEITSVLTKDGWTEDMMMASGGPTSVGSGFRKSELIAYAVSGWWKDPSANCPADAPITACDLTPAQKLYTITLDTAQSEPVASAAATTTPVGSALEPTPAADGWQTYTNADVGFSIRYPATWKALPSPAGSTEPIKTDMIQGSGGTVRLMWGTGFGGACVAYSALHLAQGQTAACYTVDANGLSHWSGIGKELPTASFAVQADTSVVEPETADLVLRILETLSFGVPADQVPVPTPPAAAPGSEVVVDNLDAAFWPKGNWYVRSEMFHKDAQMVGADCYQAPPGLEASAAVRPNLLSGSYEVFARWCGDPGDTSQTTQGVIEVHRSADDAAPQAVGVNYQAGVGQWQNLGTYDLQPGAFLDVKSAMNGSVVADAYRFVYKAAHGAEAVPTPLPSGQILSGNPPSPLQIVTSGDLVDRLSLVDPYYLSVPMTPTEKTFDDCTAFPREGCGGMRPGWEVQVTHGADALTYRVSNDYKLVAVDGVGSLVPWLAGQQTPQLNFLDVSSGDKDYDVHYDQDGTWRLLRRVRESVTANEAILPAEQGKLLQGLAKKYSTLHLRQPSGAEIAFLGLGPAVAPTDDDRDALFALADTILSGSLD